jgi:hypothetical protein
VTASHQQEHPEQPSGPTLISSALTGKQRHKATAGISLSAALWVLTPVANSASTFLLYLALTLAAVTTLATLAYIVFTMDRNAAAQRHEQQERLVRALYDHQAGLAGQILDQVRAGAATFAAEQRHFAHQTLEQQARSSNRLLEQQRSAGFRSLEQLETLIGPVATSMQESLDDLADTWGKYQAQLAEIKADITEAAELVEGRERRAEQRFREIERITAELTKRLDTVTALMGGRVTENRLRSVRSTPTKDDN